MKKSKLLNIVYLLLLPFNLQASNIPEYTVLELTSQEVTFTNGAVFSFQPSVLVDEIEDTWNLGEQVELGYKIQFQRPIIQTDFPRFVPIFTMKNYAQNTTMLGYLTQGPDTSLTIVAMDPNAGRVVLSDSTVWNLRPLDYRFFQVWEIGDEVLIGKNENIDSITYDAVIFNTNDQSVASAIEGPI